MDPQFGEKDGSSSRISGVSPHSYYQHSTPNQYPMHSYRYLDSSSSSDDDKDDFSSSLPTPNSIQSTNRRLDYMLQFLDRKLSTDHHDRNSVQRNNSHPALSEFVAKGGGTGIFKVPLRSAVDPSRPPCLELRPSPLRETQIGCFLRNIESCESQLWAASECCVRFWNFKDLYASWSDSEETIKSGDQETAPFRESVRTSPALSLVVDESKRLVWSGHKDGKIKCWPMDRSLEEHWMTCFKESLSWQAHRAPVLSLIMTTYGDYRSLLPQCFP